MDDANESGAASNGNHHSPRENGVDGKKSPRSPGSESSSGGKKKPEEGGKKSSMRSTPTTKPLGTVPQIPGNDNNLLLNDFSLSENISVINDFIDDIVTKMPHSVKV